jgi:hypothetical protein
VLEIVTLGGVILGGLRLRFFLFILFIGLSSPAYSWWMWTPGDTVDTSTQSAIGDGYHPDQPINFSHKIHAGDRKMPCQYCHSSARRSPVAGIPPLNTCMGCHKVVATDKDSIKFLTEKFNKKEPIEWVKVNDLPDHVRFSHKPHVLGGVTCQTCHGPVETTGTAEQWAPLQMGWCIGCHLEKKVSVDCNTCHY